MNSEGLWRIKRRAGNCPGLFSCRWGLFFFKMAISVESFMTVWQSLLKIGIVFLWWWRLYRVWRKSMNCFLQLGPSSTNAAAARRPASLSWEYSAASLRRSMIVLCQQCTWIRLRILAMLRPPQESPSSRHTPALRLRESPHLLLGINPQLPIGCSCDMADRQMDGLNWHYPTDAQSSL